MNKIFNAKSSTPQKAFTLLELLVVIAVLGILAVAIITALNPVKKTNQTKDSNVKSDINQIANALQAYLTSQASYIYPSNLSDLALATVGEVKTVPKQQLGTPATPCGDVAYGTGAGTSADPYTYCYAKSVALDRVALWGSLFDSAAGVAWCWDSTSAIFKPEPLGWTAPLTSNPVCP